jgi:peroxiredoxin/predicted 2-oxoglutarate/Fe(II)-dependent dioxygenase YbiX
MPLNLGEPAPWFQAPTPSNPEFVFDTAAGRYVLMAFLPKDDAAAAGEALRVLAANRARFDDETLSAFAVVRDPGTADTVQDMRGLRWFLDLEGGLSRRYGALGEDGVEAPMWLLLDPTLRVIGREPLSNAQTIFDGIARLKPVAEHAGVPLHAPVLIAPRIFEPELCARLIALHQADGGRFTGVMRDDGERTVAVMDELKKRRDVLVDDPDLRAVLSDRLERRLFPLIGRALGFGVTRIERFVVSCYDAADGAVFHAHRDSTTFGTAHRKFACSINLNEDFSGGDLRFPEYGPRTYRPPPGGAVVFSCTLLHEALRVTAGRRYAFLPFFYDEAGAQVLAAYRARIGAVASTPGLNQGAEPAA